MRKSGLIIFITALVILSSCSIQKLTVDVYVPPGIELPPDVRSILVTSRYVPATGEYEAVQWGYFESVDSAKWELSRYYAQSFADALDSTDRYISKTDFDLRMLRNNNDTLPEQLPWLGVIDIADRTRAKGLAILQGFDLLEGDIRIKENQDKSFTALKDITVKSAWRLSQPERRRMLDEKVYNYTKEFRSSGLSAAEAESSLPDSKVMLREACKWAAEQYAALLTPGVESVDRYYYREGHEKLVEAHEAIEEGNWGSAESKWKFLAYRADDDEVKAMASYNMALFCEKDGRLNQALGFARKANKLMPHKRHLDLINDLTIKLFKQEEMREKGIYIRNW